MASNMIKQTCATCRKNGGIAMCNGCQQSFCSKHFVEHRQELSQQMDNIGQEHDLLQRDLNYEKSTKSLLVRIDQWEKESIGTIQAIAAKARANLQQLSNQIKNETKIFVERLTEELRTCRETDDYTEIDIKKWMEQLKELRQMIESPSVINIEYDNNATLAIPFIKLSGPSQSLLSSSQEKRLNENSNFTFGQFAAFSGEKFADSYGNIILTHDGLTGRCSQSCSDGSCVSGIGRYLSKRHYIRFRIAQKISNYLFFGIITELQELKSNISEAKSAHGWWELGYTVVNGKTKDRNLTKIISAGDEVTLILNCDDQQIQLQHHRTNTSVNLIVDLKQCPFPWKIVLRLDNELDCVKILP